MTDLVRFGAPPRPGLLEVVGDRHRQALERAMRTIEVRRRQLIYAPGDPADRVYLVKAGVVKLSAVGLDRRELIIGFVQRGELFGERAVFDGGAHGERAEAHEDGVVGALDRTAFAQLLRESPELGYQVVRVMSLRLRTFSMRLGELLCRSARGRVAQALADLAVEYGVRDAHGIIIPVRLSQRDLGGLVGLTRETVNLVLRELRAHDLVETSRQFIRVKNLAGLQALR